MEIQLKGIMNTELRTRNRTLKTIGTTGVLSFLFFTSFFLLPSSASAATIIPRPENNLGLVGHWTFDGRDMTSNVADVSGNSNNGALTGQTATTTVIGKLGQALDFDGNNDYVDVDTVAADVTGDFSMGMWVKLPDIYTSTTWGSLLGRNTSAGDNTVMFAVGDNVGGSALDNELSVFDGGTSAFEGDTDTVIADDTWHHVFYTRSGSTGTLYVDGVEKSTHTADYTLASNDRVSLAMELDNSTPGDFVQGTLDDVRIYSRALSLDEIQALYGSGAAKFASSQSLTEGSSLASGLVGHWTFDGKDMTSNVADASGNGNDGALTGQAATTTAVGKLGQALEFDGSDDQISVPSFSDISGSPLTIAAWVKPSTSDCDTASDCMIVTIGENSELQFGTNDGTEIRFCRDFPNCVTANISNYEVDVWQHFTFVVDGSTCYMYKNGSLLNSAGSCSGTAAGNLVIGDHGAAGTRAFGGELDDLRIYDRALSVDEVAALYNLGTSKHASSADLTAGSPLSSGLVGHWTFDGKDMTSNVADVSGNGNHGTLDPFYVTTTSTVLTMGVSGQAFKFSGVSQLTDDSAVLLEVDSITPSAGYSTSSFSYAIWVRNTDADSGPFAANGKNFRYCPFTCSYSYYGWWLEEDDSTVSLYKGTGIGENDKAEVASGSLGLNEWTHVAFTVDASGGVVLYLNGVSVDTGSMSSMSTAGGAFSIGSLEDDTRFHQTYSDPLDDIRMYSRALSADEVQQLYNLGK